MVAVAPCLERGGWGGGKNEVAVLDSKIVVWDVDEET
jgi:hypothetical protein